MRWEPDVDRGEWLRARLQDADARPWTVHMMIPRGYERYARIFHRVRPTGGPLDAPPVPWHEIAAQHGAPSHPLMSWDEINQRQDGPVHQDPLPTADDFDGPDLGRLEEDQLAAIAVHLARHTTTPDHGVAAVWDGYGGLFAREQGRSWNRLTIGRKRHRITEETVPVQGLDDAVFTGPRLQLPHRNHVLFDAGIEEFIGPWTTRAPWVFDSHPQSPSILWPEDRAWILVCDTDWTSTIIGGPVELMAPLLTDPAVDGAIIPADGQTHGFG